MDLWITGQYRDALTLTWEFQGIFDSKQKAIAACRSDRYHIFKVKLNESLPDDRVDNLPCWYPLDPHDLEPDWQ